MNAGLTEPLWALMLLGMRTGGLCLTAPVFGSRNVPARLRLAFAVWLSVCALWMVRPHVVLPASVWDGALAAVWETALGLCTGFLSRVMLEAALASGQLVAQSVGMGFGAMLDPLSGAESSALGEWLYLLATSLAVALGVHRELVAWLVESSRELPLGQMGDLSGLLARVVSQTLQAMALAVRLAAPVLAAALCGNVVLGLMGKMAPQLNLANVGFALAWLGAMGALFWVGPDLLRICAEQAVQALNPG